MLSVAPHGFCIYHQGFFLSVVPTLTVLKVMDSPKYLEDLTGLTDLMSDADLMAGVIDIADDDTFSVSSGDI